MTSLAVYFVIIVPMISTVVPDVDQLPYPDVVKGM